jgi:superfamily II DNA/RNA helicase
VEQFKKGVFNVLVATSIGEEGLDIGDVDLIVCYDSSASPIRMLQRMGRTGRKREGHIVFLVTEGKEQRDHAKSLDAYEQIQKKIASGRDFEFRLDESPRILPKEFLPDCVKQWIQPPEEDKAALALKVDKKKGVKRKERDWSLPDDVETGFVSAKVVAKRTKGGENDFTAGLATGRKRASQLKANGTRSRKIYSDDEVDGSPRTLSPKARRLSTRNTNISPISTTRTPKALYRSFDEIVSSSGSEMGDIETELKLIAKRQEKGKGKEKEKNVVTIDSDDNEYGLPSEFEQTLPKMIRIRDFSDEE